MLRHQFHSSSKSKIVRTADKILEIISGMLDLNTFFLARVDGRTSKIISVLNREEKILHKNNEERLDEVFCRFVVDNKRKCFAVGDLLENKQTKEMAMNRLGGGGSFIGVPVILKTGEIFGTLCAIDREEYEFTEEDIQLFRTMADLLSQIIELEWLSTHDPLTRMYNRNFIHGYFEQAVLKDERLALLFLDLDRFKMINDTLGHHAGDELLKSLAERLDKALRNEGIVARLGGDEFAIIIRNNGREQVSAVAEHILDLIKEPFVIEGSDYLIGASIGVSMLPEDTDDPETLIKFADVAMYQAKENRDSSYQFYETRMSGALYRKMSLELGMRRAIERDEFHLHYQPIVNTASDSIEWLECLIRWNHPEWGAISPAEFIPLAEDSGLIARIGEWVLREACRQHKEWQRNHLEVAVSVNISAAELLNSGFADNVARILDETGMEAHFLVIEVTESMEFQHVDLVQGTMTALKGMGVKIAMDDFGTGYSSLNYLKNMPIDIVKIDKSFVQNMLQNRYDASIIEAVILMAQTIDLTIVAEGVETAEQLAYLNRKGIHEIQGFYLYRPMPADAVTAILPVQDG